MIVNTLLRNATIFLKGKNISTIDIIPT